LINPNAIEISGNTIDENCDGDISTGVVENSTNNLSAYPNPVHELLHIDQYDINQNKATLLDMVGNVVRDLTPGTNEITQLSSGVYFIKFETFKSKKLLFKKIVKL